MTPTAGRCVGCEVASRFGERVTCIRHQPVRQPTVIGWDWREQPDLDRLAAVVRDVSGGLVHITPVDTGGDQYAVVVSDVVLTPAEAVARYEAWSENGEIE